MFDLQVSVRWRVLTDTPRQRAWQPLPPADSSFVCQHWRSHHEVADRALDNPSGRASSPPVAGRRLAATAAA